MRQGGQEFRHHCVRELLVAFLRDADVLRQLNFVLLRRDNRVQVVPGSTNTAMDYIGSYLPGYV
jgi:hypothetical protein